MFWWDADRVLAWLATQGASRSPEGLWSVNRESGLTDNALLHEILFDDFVDPNLTPNDRLELKFGMLDHFDDYAAAMYLAWEFTGVGAAHADRLDLVWIFCREMLDREEQSIAVEYWLWVDWFEDLATSDVAFLEMVRGFGPTAPSESRLAPVRRIDRVLRLSGPVPWATKFPYYEAALTDSRLHDSLREAIAACERDAYGQIDKRAAAHLLERIAGQK